MPPFYEKYKGPFFLLQVKTKIGTGNIIGRNEDNSQFLLTFKKSELTQEALQERNVPGVIINLWIDVEDIYEITDIATAPLPKRVTPLKIKRKDKNGIHTKRTKIRKAD